MDEAMCGSNETGTLEEQPINIGVKLIRAIPMGLTTFNKRYNNIVPSTPGEAGYRVTYPDGYISWAPKKVFEEAYRRLTDKERIFI